MEEEQTELEAALERTLRRRRQGSWWEEEGEVRRRWT